MNGFSRTFLNEDWKALPKAPRFYLCAFGKHPGWNDHLDDIGVATASLIEARRILYGGIAHQIESAAWQKAGPEKVAAGFDHVIQWSRPGETICGLMWSSQDGKGRSLYPMITLAHGAGQSLEWVGGTVLPILEEMAAKCRGATSAEVVIALVNNAQQRLRSGLPETTGDRPAVSLAGVASWADYFSREPEGLRRVLHHLRGHFAAFAPGCREWCEGEKAARSGGMRLPQIPGLKPVESLNAWLAFLSTQLDPIVPLLGMLSVSGDWVDVIFGEPAPADFFVLRALPSAVPRLTDIPYQLDRVMQAGFGGIFDDLARGQLPAKSCFNNELVETSREEATRWLMRHRPSEKPGFFNRFLRGGNS
ncbi:MAG TPA: hypothetical protein VGM64_15720 [Lacunisphaera sp.]|jgi:hypothetical protein